MWLVRDGEVLATLALATSRADRRRGLLGHDHYAGALLLDRARCVHTIGMRFPIDVAFCDRDLTVLAVATMRPHRMGRPRLRATCVIEAEAGAFARWRLATGDRLEIKGT